MQNDLKKLEIKVYKYMMPVTFRYSLLFGMLTGFIHTVYSKKLSKFFIHSFITTPIGGFGLCYKELLEIQQLKQKL